MISLHRTSPIQAIEQVRHLRKGRELTKKATKNDMKEDMQSKNLSPSHKFFYVFFRPGFTWSSNDIIASHKKSTSKKEPTSVSEITI